MRDEQSKAVKELSNKKNLADSLVKHLEAMNKKWAQDSVTLATAENQRLLKIQAGKKLLGDSIASLWANLGQKLIRDSLAIFKKAPVIQQPGPAPAVVGATTGSAVAPADISKPGTFSHVATDTPRADMPSIGFAKNSADIRPSALEQLKHLATVLEANPGSQLVIYGLASANEPGPKLLSLKRADAALRYLVQSGIASKRIKWLYLGSSISVSGCSGQKCPEETLVPNRSVVFQVVKR